MYELAEHLHKTVGELADMDTAEVTGWRAYFYVKHGGASEYVAEDVEEQAAGWTVQRGDGVTKWVRAGGKKRVIDG